MNIITAGTFICFCKCVLTGIYTKTYSKIRQILQVKIHKTRILCREFLVFGGIRGVFLTVANTSGVYRQRLCRSDRN